MADNIIKVNVTASKSQRVNVSSAQVGTEITASSDTGKFWAQNSKNWAVSENIVDNEDYSSKYYANKAKTSAENAKSYSNSTREEYEKFIEDAIGYVNELNELKEAGGLQINEAVADGKEEIERQKNSAIDVIENVAQESIGDIKVLTTLEIGDIGIAPLGIDETKGKRRYLNGQVIIQDQYVEFTNKVKSAIALYPSLACTESEWQTTATMTVGGQVGKFVVDDEAGTIRLPKIIMPIQGLTDLSKLAEIVEAGLPNITGNLMSANLGVYDTNSEGTNGAFVRELDTRSGVKGSGSSNDVKNTIFSFNASLSNPIYGNSNTVQQEQIQYPYFIQVATGAETEDNIINEIELNNPFSLLDYKYSEYELNNLSWLRSNGQYNSKAIYPAVYDLLLKIYNGTETKVGVSVKLWDDTSATDYDFRINIAEETFMLPTKVKLASGKAVVGNGMTIGLTDGINNAGMGYAKQTYPRVNSYGTSYGLPVGDVGSNTGVLSDDRSIGLTTDPTKSGIETSDNGLYLYFYIGETVQNANLINAGRIEEHLHSLIPNNSSLIAGYTMPSNKYIDLTLGASGTTYTAPANGFVMFSRTLANQQFISLTCVDNGLGVAETSSGTQTPSVFLPISKGAKFSATYSGTGATNIFRFIYAQGEV